MPVAYPAPAVVSVKGPFDIRNSPGDHWRFVAEDMIRTRLAFRLFEPSPVQWAQLPRHVEFVTNLDA